MPAPCRRRRHAATVGAPTWNPGQTREDERLEDVEHAVAEPLVGGVGPKGDGFAPTSPLATQGPDDPCARYARERKTAHRRRIVGLRVVVRMGLPPAK